MQQIIVPTDFSEIANNALDYAVNLAKVYSIKVTIYHACQIPALSIHRPAPSSKEQEKLTLLRESRQKLRSLCARAREKGIYCSIEQSISPVYDGIVDASEKTGADLIVMGTSGGAGLSGWLFGSKTADVIQNSVIPVLAIPKEATYRPIKTIVLATDYQDSDFAFISKLIKLASLFASELKILHVRTEEGESRSEALSGSFRSKISSSTDYGKISFHLTEKDDAISAINRFVTECDAEMISMASSRRNLFNRIFCKSITGEKAYFTEIPLLAFNT